MYVSVTCFLIPIPYFPHAQPWRRMFLFFAGFSAARQHCSSAALHLICMSGLHTMYVVCSRIHVRSKCLPAVHVSPFMDPSTLVPTNATHAPIQSSVLSSTHFLFYSNFSLSTNYSCPLWNFPTIHSCAPSIRPYPYTRTHTSLPSYPQPSTTVLGPQESYISYLIELEPLSSFLDVVFDV